jgi:iron complex outermembrane receptor protein
LWGKNITDKRYVLQGFSQVNLGNGYRIFGAPRTFGISAKKHF